MQKKNSMTITNSSFINYAKGWFITKKQVQVRSKIKSIIIALILGLIVSFAIMAITTKANPFDVLATMVRVAFGKNMVNYTLSITGLLLIAGLANAIAFKTGLFNIGVSGQMFFTGAMSVLLGLTLFKGLGVLGLVLLIWFGAVTGGIIAGFIGWLKARYNVNEVVTSILLNWGLFYIARYIITILGKNKTIGKEIISPSGSTNVLAPEFQISSHYYGLIILMVGLVITLIISVILWKTTFGHAMKVTGLSPNVAKYAGINVNKQIIMSMFLSGIVSGILGVMFFVIQEKQVGSQYLNFNILPNIGFEGIAIALLAYSNPLGIIPIAFIFGILKSGSGGLVEYQIDNSFSNLIIGIMMYFAAISIMFMRFKPIKMIYTWLKINKRYYPKQFAVIDKEYKVMFEEFKTKSDKDIKNWNILIEGYQLQIIKEENLYLNKIQALNTTESKENLAAQKKLATSKKNKIIDGWNTKISICKEDIQNIKTGYKNIKKYRKTQINLFKILKQKEQYQRTHQLNSKSIGGK